MEGIIVFIILGIISSLFSKNKEKKPTQQMPSFDKNARQLKSKQIQKKQPMQSERPFIQSFEDFAKKYLGDLETKVAPQKVESDSILPKEVQVKKEEMEEQSERESMQSRLKERMVMNNRVEVSHAEKEVTEPVSTFMTPSKNALVQAIVMSEVLGPPKARQNNVKRNTQS